MKPLADRLRPKNIEDMVGQSHIIGEGKVLNKIIKNNSIPNMIFYGPPGTGKTTLANIIANTTGKKYVKLNAVNCGVKEIKDCYVGGISMDLSYDANKDISILLPQEITFVNAFST